MVTRIGIIKTVNESSITVMIWRSIQGRDFERLAKLGLDQTSTSIVKLKLFLKVVPGTKQRYLYLNQSYIFRGTLHCLPKQFLKIKNSTRRHNTKWILKPVLTFLLAQRSLSLQTNNINNCYDLNLIFKEKRNIIISIRR